MLGAQRTVQPGASALRTRTSVLLDATPLHTAHRFRGVGSYVQHLLDAYLAAPDDVDVEVLAVAGRDVAAPVAARVRRPALPRYRMPNLWPEILYRRALAATRADVFHATDPNALIPHPGVPTVATLHDLIPLAFHDQYLRSWRKSDLRLAHAMYRRRLARADCVICVSEETRRDCLDLLEVDMDRVVVIPEAGDPDRFFPEDPERVAAVRHLRVLDRPYFLYAGSVEPHKNVERLIDAFAAVRRRLDGEPMLVAVGRWTNRDQQRFADLVDRAGVTGWVQRLGYVPSADLRALYSGAAAFVFPSLKEGFGLPVLEAMMCGAPVVAADILSLREICGGSAVFVDPRDTGSIVEGMVRAYGDEGELAAAGTRRAAAFSWAQTARATLDVYRSVI